jgi:endonuclease I
MLKTLLFLLPFSLNAQIPNYYDGIDFSTSNRDLQADLTELITATHHNQISYTPGAWNTLLQSDLDLDDPQKVLLIYGYNDNLDPKFHRTRDKELRNTGGCGSCTGRWEREHVFPKSLATPTLDTDYPSAGTDAHNLRAVDRQMNSSRSNRPYTNSSGDAKTVGGSAFYPGDEWIGDVARILMYMYLRYETQCNPNNVTWESTNTFSPNIPDLLLTWNAIDPPSEFEMVRNEIIYNTQGNRNPFIDNPYLATLTWGGQSAQNNWQELSNITINPTEYKIDIFPNPTSSFIKITAKGFKTAKLYDLNGKILEQSNTPEINLANYTNGIYILSITLDNGSIYTKKVIKN